MQGEFIAIRKRKFPYDDETPLAVANTPVVNKSPPREEKPAESILTQPTTTKTQKPTKPTP